MVNLTPSEQALILTIREIGYGELVDLELDDISGGQPQKVSLTAAEEKLLKLIWDGNGFFCLIKIHDGQPAYAQVPYNRHGFHGTKLYKF